MARSRSSVVRRRRLAVGMSGAGFAALLAVVAVVASAAAGGAVGGIGAFVAAVAGSVWGASAVLALGGDS